MWLKIKLDNGGEHYWCFSCHMLFTVHFLLFRLTFHLTGSFDVVRLMEVDFWIISRQFIVWIIEWSWKMLTHSFVSMDVLSDAHLECIFNAFISLVWSEHHPNRFVFIKWHFFYHPEFYLTAQAQKCSGWIGICWEHISARMYWFTAASTCS